MHLNEPCCSVVECSGICKLYVQDLYMYESPRNNQYLGYVPTENQLVLLFSFHSWAKGHSFVWSNFVYCLPLTFITFFLKKIEKVTILCGNSCLVTSVCVGLCYDQQFDKIYCYLKHSGKVYRFMLFEYQLFCMHESCIL